MDQDHTLLTNSRYPYSTLTISCDIALSTASTFISLDELNDGDIYRTDERA
jgi:hypothetical protein